MWVYEDADAVREQLAAKVEAQARKDGLHLSDSDEVVVICENRMAAAFIKARLCPKTMNFNHKRIISEYASRVASELHAA